MKSAVKEPIPIPFRQRWQAFRVLAIPVVIFAAALVAVVLLWHEQAAPRAIPGEVEAFASELTSPGSGTLVQFQVSRFQEVEGGAVLGQVLTTPPDVLHASLAVLKAEIELTRLGWIDPFLDQQRNALQLESLKLDWLESKATLAILRIELQQAEREHERTRRLFESGMVAEEEHERAQSLVTVLEERAAQGEILAGEIERSLDSLRIGRDGESFAPAALIATLELQKERLALAEAELRPVNLVAPISGTIMLLHRRNGEHVAEGEAIATIQSPEAGRIVAYLRQPFDVEPAVGMTVEVASRNSAGKRAVSEILLVGPQMEALTEVFRRPFSNRYESGLPLVVALPADLEARPGELVDVTLLP